MRTQQEILERIKSLQEDESNLLDFQRQDLVASLDYKNAKPFLKKDSTTTKKEWEKIKLVDFRKKMIDYMDFAWEKANNCRGLSAVRSLEHYISWLWLDGDDELHLTLNEYKHYGKDHLRKICEYLGLNPDDYDDGIRVNDESELEQPTNYIPDGYEIVEITPKNTDKKQKELDEPEDSDAPETLNSAWLSGCQIFPGIIYNDDGVEKIFKPYNFKPQVGAVAVKYDDNSFSVFIGVGKGENEQADIAYIKRMGQRTTEQIARGIFPQFDDMTYHN